MIDSSIGRQISFAPRQVRRGQPAELDGLELAHWKTDGALRGSAGRGFGGELGSRWTEGLGLVACGRRESASGRQLAETVAAS